MHPRGFFPPRNFHPPPRNFRPPNPNQFQNVNVTRHFNPVEHQPRQQFFPPPRPENIPQMPMQIPPRKRTLNPPEPPKFSEISREEQLPKINPAYKASVDEELKKLDEKYKVYSRDPESHPFYGKEWQLFWNRKADELTKRGEDPADYDFHDEWCEYFIDRIRELHEEETKWKVEQLRRKYGITTNDYPPPKRSRTMNEEKPAVVEVKKDQYDSDEDDDYLRPSQGNESQGFGLQRQVQPGEFDGEPIPPWKIPGPPDNQAKRTKPTRFNQPGLPDEYIDHPKFRQSSFEQPQGQGFNPPNPNPHIRPAVQNPQAAYQMRPESSSNATRFMQEPSFAAKKSKRGIEKLLSHMSPTIQLENVPLTMRITEILDFFCNKLRGIVGCFRATDYINKIPSRIVYLIIMDEHEIEMMENLREMYMEGNYVKITSVKLMNGSALMDTSMQEVPGAPQSLFLTNLEKRSVETTSYLRELAKFFEPQFTITGIRICHNSKIKKSRNFGFANFINKASVDEYDGRTFKMFEYEVKCSRTQKIPLLIHSDHSDYLENDPLLWSKEVRGINLLNVNL